MAASVVRSRQVRTPCIKEFRSPTHKRSNVATSRMPVNRGGRAGRRPSIRPRNMDVKSLDRWTQTPDHFTGPERLAQNRCPTIVGLANRTKRSEEHTSELQSRGHLVCRLLLEKKK